MVYWVEWLLWDDRNAISTQGHRSPYTAPTTFTPHRRPETQEASARKTDQDGNYETQSRKDGLFESRKMEAFPHLSGGGGMESTLV